MEITKINPNKISQSDIEEIADFFKKGKILVFPTDTVYGLLADLNNKKSVEKIFRIKKRNKRKLLPIFVPDIKTAKKLVKIPKSQEEILKRIWPGRITVVFDKRKGGIRIPDYPLLLKVLKKTGPLVQTSANISGQPATCQIDRVIKSFKKSKIQPDIIFDAANLEKSQPSMVIDLSGRKVKILRRGDIKKEKILRILK